MKVILRKHFENLGEVGTVVEVELEAANKLKVELEKTSVSILVKVGEEERLFGSVTAQDVAAALNTKGFDIDKRKIDLAEPIKALGIHDVNVKLHPKVIAVVKTWVVKEDA